MKLTRTSFDYSAYDGETYLGRVCVVWSEETGETPLIIAHPLGAPCEAVDTMEAARKLLEESRRC